MYIAPASHTHPGYDSGVELARHLGDVVLGHVAHEHAGNGADAFGGPPLVIATTLADDTLAILYTFAWRWSESTHQNVLAWWCGDGEFDCATPEKYGPVLQD